MNLYHFYHIYADGQWFEPVSEHIRALKESGLYDGLTMFAIGIVGNPQKRDDVKVYLDSLGVKYNIAAEADQGWEAVTQQPMHDFSQNNDGLILYCHTKGSSTIHDVNDRWRRSMTWHCVCKWQMAISLLQSHGSYGSHWIQPLVSMPEHRMGNWMYAGTFYWIHANIMRTWMRVPLTHRFESEGWIGYGYAENPWPVWDCAPYFPNSDTFMDDWVVNPGSIPAERGKSIPPIQTINILP